MKIPWMLAVLFAVSSALADYSDMSMEELANAPVVKTSKQSDRLFDAAASAFVFDEEAIDFLPVDSIPELLRYAPGTNISRPSNGVWEVGIRGTNIRYFTRSIFGVDEQNLYGSVFGGLFGSQHDIPMDDIASIEVVYGSGGSVWTTNAVNGMMNVIMKSAFETEDSLLKTQLGTHNRKVVARTGWAVSDNTSARIYASYGNRSPRDSAEFEDNWETTRAGFQSDTRFTSRDLLTVSAEAYSSLLDEFKYTGNRDTGSIFPLLSREEQQGFNAQAKWTHQQSRTSGFSLRSFTGFSEFRSSYVEFDYGAAGLEFKGRTAITDKNELFLTSSVTRGKFDFGEHPSSRFSEEADEAVVQGNVSVQYDYHVIKDKLTLSSGLTFQYDDSSVENHLLPSLRAVYHVSEQSRFWTAYSRVYRRIPPAFRYAEYLEFMTMPIPPTPLPTPIGTITLDRAFVYARSSDEMSDERMDTFEAGYRHIFNNKTEFFINTFYSKLKDAMSAVNGLSQPELGFGSEHPYLIQYLDLHNSAEVEAYGGEISFKTKFDTGTAVILNYSYLKESFESYPQYQNLAGGAALETFGISPKHNASVWISQKWMSDYRADVGLTYSGSYSNLLGTQNAITQMDLRFSWLPSESLQLSVVGRNLLDNDINLEVNRDFLTSPTETEPEWYLELKWKF